MPIQANTGGEAVPQAERRFFDPVSEALKSDDPAVVQDMRDRLYGVEQGLLYLDPSSDNSKLVDFLVDNHIPVIAVPVESGSRLPRLLQGTERVVGEGAIISFFEQSQQEKP